MLSACILLSSFSQARHKSAQHASCPPIPSKPFQKPEFFSPPTLPCYHCTSCKPCKSLQYLQSLQYLTFSPALSVVKAFNKSPCLLWGMVVASLGKPEWLKIKAFTPEHKAEFASHQKIKNAVHSRGLTTVCEESHCPNIPECWANEGTATFMVMGDTCTRGCRFCQVNASGKGKPLDPEEPRKLAEAIAEMGLD